MDFLNKAYAQVTELFRSMTPAARITTALLLGVIVVSLAFLFRQHGSTADEYLFGAKVFTSGEIANMQAALAAADLNDWEEEGNRLRVPRAMRHKYIAALAEGDALPEDYGSALESMVTQQNPFENRKSQEDRMLYALQRDLSYTLREFDGIEAASVQIQTMASDTFPYRQERRAAVSVKDQGTLPLDANQVKMIRDVVAFGGGVLPENVVIADTNSGRSHLGPSADSPFAAENNVYSEAQRQVEVEWKGKIEDRLSMYPGAKVTVAVELGDTLENRQTSITYDPKPTAIQSNTTSKESVSQNTSGGGRPGAEPNAVGNRSLSVTTPAGSENTTTETHEEQRFVPGVTHKEIVTAPLKTEVIRVSIGIPKSHFLKVWQEQNPVPAGQPPKEPTATELQTVEAVEKKSIEDAIAGLLPDAPPGTDKYPKVTVIPYIDVPLPAPQAPSAVATTLSWFASSWQTLALCGLALVGVVFLRGMIRTAQATADAGAPTQADAARLAESTGGEGDEEAADEQDLANSLRGRFQQSGRSLREELAELVREDPDAAAMVLQNWISDAA